MSELTTHNEQWLEDYWDRCAYASQTSGASAIAKALRNEGYTVAVEQTGGMTMVPTIYLENGAICVTDESGYGDEAYCVGGYPMNRDGELEFENPIHGDAPYLDSVPAMLEAVANLWATFEAIAKAGA